MDSARRSRISRSLPFYAGIFATVAGISYSAWVLEFPLGGRVDPVDGYVSELSAVDQPWHWLFSAGDLITGILTIAVAVICLGCLEHRRWNLLGWGFLLAFGISAVGDAIFSMDCAPSTDTACALRERAGLVSFSHEFHDVTSSAVIAFGIAALLALGISARRYRPWSALAHWGPLLAAAEAITALATLVLMYFGVWLGLVQRMQITILCAGLLLIGWQLCSLGEPLPQRRERSSAAPALAGRPGR